MSPSLPQSSRCCSLLIGAALAFAAFDWAAAQSNQPIPSVNFSREDDPVELTVANARAGYDGVWVKLSPKSAKDLAAFTQEHLNEVIDILVDGQVVFSPKIITPILGGGIQLLGQGPMEFERSWTMALRLKSGDASLVVRVNRLAPH
jgi:preprotein translocase subunit SecD